MRCHLLNRGMESEILEEGWNRTQFHSSYGTGREEPSTQNNHMQRDFFFDATCITCYITHDDSENSNCNRTSDFLPERSNGVAFVIQCNPKATLSNVEVHVQPTDVDMGIREARY